MSPAFTYATTREREPDLKRSRIALRFADEALERGFRAEQTISNTRALRETASIALAIMVLSMVAIVAGLHQSPRHPIVILLCIAVIVTLEFRIFAGRQTSRATFWGNGLFASVIGLAVAVGSPEILLHLPGSAAKFTFLEFGYFGLVLFAIVSFMFLRLPLVTGLLINLMAVTAYGAILFRTPWFPPIDAALHLGCAASGVVAGLAGGWFLERLARDNFAQRALLAWRERALEHARSQSEALLHNVLPVPIADRLKAGESPIADGPNELTIVFADLVGFTPLAERLPAPELVSLLDRLFSGFDDLVARAGAEKIKTMGDAYMAVVGAPTCRPDHCRVGASLAVTMREQVRALSPIDGHRLQIRIGLETGSAVTGVIGRHKFAYDLWGDCVNTAARMESQGEPDRIHVTENVAKQLGSAFRITARGPITIKGKGTMNTFWLDAT